MRMVGLILIFVTCLCRLEGHAKDRMYVAAKVNGKPVVLTFDTGFDRSILWSTTARRLGFTNLLGGYGVFAGTTESCTLSLGKATSRMWFSIIEVLPYLKVPGDGVLGWKTVSENILRLDAETGLVTPLKQVPREAKAWVRIPLVPHSTVLRLAINRKDQQAAPLDIDTGNPYGVRLLSGKWQSWREANPKQPVTLFTDWNPSYHCAAWEESWAAEIIIGPLRLTDAPLSHAIPADVFSGPSSYEATLGMAALRRLDVIVDGPRDVAYLRPKQTPAPSYAHNGIGADFVAGDTNNNAFVFRVLTNSPAWKAGVRDGDLLLKLGDYDVSKWRDETNKDDRFDFAAMPPGRKLEFTVQRGSNTFATTVISEHILGPLAARPAGLGKAEISGETTTNDFSGLPIRINSNAAYEFFGRGGQYISRSNFDQGIADFKEAVRLNHQFTADLARAYVRRGAHYLAESNVAKVIADSDAAIRLSPKLAPGYLLRAGAYQVEGEFAQAVRALRKAARLNPRDDLVYNNIAWLEATSPDASVRNGKDAVRAATRACELTGWGNGNWIDTLAAAYAEAGQFKRAIEFQEQALHIGNPGESEQKAMREKISLYQQSRPFREQHPLKLKE